MLSVKQVADMSGRTERTIWRMIASGKLKHTKDESGRVWIQERDVPPRRQETSDGVIEQLLRDVADLQERIARLEQQPIRPRAFTPAPATPRITYRPSNTSASSLPTSMRAWGRWVEDHGGARADGVRDRWSEVRTWSTTSEALDGIRQRGYTLHPCTDPSCGCHDLLATS